MRSFRSSFGRVSSSSAGSAGRERERAARRARRRAAPRERSTRLDARARAAARRRRLFPRDRDELPLLVRVDQGLHDGAVEPIAGEISRRRWKTKRMSIALLVGPGRRHRVERVGDRHDARLQRDLLAREAVRDSRRPPTSRGGASSPG